MTFTRRRQQNYIHKIVQMMGKVKSFVSTLMGHTLMECNFISCEKVNHQLPRHPHRNSSSQ